MQPSASNQTPTPTHPNINPAIEQGILGMSETAFALHLYRIGACNVNYLFNKMWELEEELALMDEETTLKLAAISVASLSNTIDSLTTNRIEKNEPFWTPALEDVYTAVKREMRERRYKETHWKDLECVTSQCQEKDKEIQRLRSEICTLRDELAEALKQANALFV